MSVVVSDEREHQDDELRLVLDVATNAISQEFQIAERLDAKARNQLTVAGRSS